MLTRTLFTRLDTGDSDCVPVVTVRDSLLQSTLPFDANEVRLACCLCSCGVHVVCGLHVAWKRTPVCDPMYRTTACGIFRAQ